MRIKYVLLQLYAAAALGCAGSSSQVKPTVADQSPPSLYPLGAGYAWSYDVESGDGDPVLAIARVTAFQDGIATVSTGPEAAQRYVATAQGVSRAGEPGFLLKAPIATGASWESAPGTTARVVSVSEQVSTEAGAFSGCVLVEELNTNSGQRVRTTYCPGVGPTVVVSEMQIRGRVLTVTAKLRGYSLGGDSD
ncbi:MAG TPA: hypothetical protein VJR89_24040 [Polyangiales bacterium]|nr:hypothetical protein [Polyangiales bacterium]